MTKALIFDLDNCLAPSREVGEELYEPAFEAIREANRGQLGESQLSKAFEDVWRHPLDWVAERYGFSKAMLDAAWQAFEKMEVSRPMVGYDDIEVIAEWPVSRFLVTSGFRRLQESKIRALNIRPLFTNVYVDAIDEPGHLGKAGIFKTILD